jgi:hypothetical protein
MKQLLLSLAAVAAFIILVGIFTQKNLGGKPFMNLGPTNKPASQKQISVGNTKIKIEIADTQVKQATGLSHRTYLPEDSGMLFDFTGRNASPTFWMKDMFISIDMIWIKDKKVQKIDKNVSPPEPNTPDTELPTYNASMAIDYVLEVNAGFSDKNNIQVGDSVQL